MSNFSDVIPQLWAEIKAFFVEAENVAVVFTKAFLQALSSGGGALLADAATAAVQAAETQGGTGQDKMTSALTAIKGTLENAGTVYVENAARLAIEAAVAKLKQDTAALTVIQDIPALVVVKP